MLAVIAIHRSKSLITDLQQEKFFGDAIVHLSFMSVSVHKDISLIIKPQFSFVGSFGLVD